jgi:hypothetical protein
MKQISVLGLIVVAALLLLGMGQMESTGKPGEIPNPDQEVTAIIMDNEGLTLTLTQFSINGKTYLQGRLGAGRAAIPFSRVRAITLSPEAKDISVKLELTDHTQMNLLLDKGLTAYGKIKAGTYQVLLDRLKRIEIQSISERKKQ